ncbi:hypothetical protein [Leptospira kmetyi]|uniref:VCBS repeat-containing protein n=1 Tax=Leptospira kmetyi TaxID=408139 RepID=A0ABX4N8T1_9LEPT|nr:hypothetical protein [Leptospira kmetyi]PJZ28988.1 hypothetical protein CH378_15190 [Leptospira kmetyi]
MSNGIKNNHLFYVILLLLICLNSIIGQGQNKRFIHNWKTDPNIPPGWIKIDSKMHDVNADGKLDYIYLITDNITFLVILAEKTTDQEWRFIILESSRMSDIRAYLKQHSEITSGHNLSIKITKYGFGYGLSNSDEMLGNYSWNQSTGIYESH